MGVKTVVEIEKAAQILKLLGDKTRLSMMKLLQTNECCVCELVEIYNASQPSISQHLRKLKDVGLVKEKRKGQWIFYSLNQAHEHHDFVISLLDSLPSQDEHLTELEKQGLRISCCE
ncbi:MAG: metalloregulator ArsR/SmtB family transcription factor [Priestia megaterium]|jgi:ArsR family transcriptional regulator|uniref:ArsR/SmtB family transcription factor n=1 Tax=Priestia megaterium TaxID=1404 RepID=UPI0034D74819